MYGLILQESTAQENTAQESTAQESTQKGLIPKIKLIFSSFSQ